MRMRFVILTALFLPLCALAQEQIAIGGKRFERSAAQTGKRGEWVLYEKGAPKNEGTRRWLTRRVLVELKPGSNATALRGLAGVAGVSDRGKYAVVDFAGRPDAAIDGATALQKLPVVRSAQPLLARQWSRRFIPDDPLFGYSAANAGYQWHLRNTGENGATTGIDVNVVSAWDSYKGAGIRIGIVDDGLQVAHPDLAPNADLLNDYDFNDLDDDPSPGAEDFHGTACAGVAAARGNNGLGVSGVAPEATLVGLRLIAAPTTDADEADAIAHAKDIIDLKSNSWGPFDSAFGAYGPGPLSHAAILDAVTTGRGGKGTVFLWAAGNGNYSGDDSNYDGWANTPQAIAVSAINDKGRASWYSEPGANILVCAPSNGGKQGVTTTDRSGADGYNEDGGTVEHPDFTDTDYTNTFGGTSSATPAAAGVIALMLQANPNLTYRDVQEILVRTAKQNDPFDGDWVTNGAGFHFNIRYGAGLVNAQAATSMAVGWTPVAPLETKSYTQTALAQPIPDADVSGTSRTFTVPAADNLRLEHVLVKVKATHPYAGNLEWRLTSPSGVKVRLARARFNDTSANLDWTFMTTHYWGERSEGEWKLEVFDRMIDYTGTLDDVTITFQGTATSPALPKPVITSNWIIVGREGWELTHQITASNFATSFNAGRYFYPGLPAGLTLNPITGMITGTPTETGLFDAYQSATNATGTTEEFAYFYILAATPALSTAVEQPPTTKIIPFGFGDPILQSAVTHDGVDAIETAAVEDEEYSGIEFTVNGPARLEFQWKVSSEKNYDYLVLTVDGYVRDYITGETDWTLSSTDLGDGPHNVDIYYSKDEATVKGQDKGWIDEIVITPINTAPVVELVTVEAYLGVYFRHQIEASNAPASYAAENLPAGLSLHPSTGLIYGSVATTGDYPVIIHATNSFGTGTETIILHIGTVPEGLAEALDAPAQTITTSGDLSWVPQQLYTSDGDDAARSGPIGNLQQTVMTTEVTGPCKLTFYWGVSSEADYDFLRFYIDDVEKDAISGEVGWSRQKFLIPPGTHTLKWAYIKDDFTASGLDSGFVDRLAMSQDSDGDGIYADDETWFGTSDSDVNSRPQFVLSRNTSTTLQFPSVSGNDYRIEYSDDLIKWTPVIITAAGASTTWTDLNAVNKTRRFYRVVIP
ncbi:MAG: S8 family serine peptidase [Prosthecobacter sp.]|uniref:S8 family serine peptidase n=1 Tax=Prosthecobacter sp. TaxID=1965333 RepID=UPI0019EA2660|nr:S8 family serine peptidase [Prosthecobacter sp.]MBE2283225.1 S8 family serine peptidase [Prosthecobacter sp.]